MMVQDTDIAYVIWDKKIAALNGEALYEETNPRGRRNIKVPNELVKLHKEVFITVEIFFIIGIPFFILLSCNITFTTTRYLDVRKSITIFKALKEIYMYYLKRSFQIITLHVDVEFVPL